VTVTANPDTAFHMALHGGEDIVIGKTAAGKFLQSGIDHHRWPADQSGGGGRVDVGMIEQGRHQSHRSVPSRLGCVHSEETGNPRMIAPRPQIGMEGDIGRQTAAVEEGEAGKGGLPVEAVVDHRPQRRQPDPAGNEEQVASFQGRHGEGLAVWAPQADLLTFLHGVHECGQGACPPHAQLDGAGPGRGRGEGDRRLAMVGHRNHHELARQVVEGAVALLIGKSHFKGLDLGVFDGDFSDHCRLGDIVFCTLCLHGCLVVSFFPGSFPLIFAGHPDEADDINAAEADADAAAAADTTGAAVLGDVIVQLVHETLADGAGPRIHRVVTAGHAGEAPKVQASQLRSRTPDCSSVLRSLMVKQVQVGQT